MQVARHHIDGAARIGPGELLVIVVRSGLPAHLRGGDAAVERGGFGAPSAGGERAGDQPGQRLLQHPPAVQAAEFEAQIVGGHGPGPVAPRRGHADAVVAGVQATVAPRPGLRIEIEM